MKYRYLTYQELTVVEDDFSNFLYDHGFSQFEWKVLQDQYSDQALSMLGDYSDLIFDRLVKDVKYLEFRSAKQLRAIECHTDHMISIGIQLPDKSSLNLTDLASLSCIDKSDSQAYKCFKEIHNYSSDRDHEIFELIEAGCYVVDASVFEQLNRLRVTFQN